MPEVTNNDNYQPMSFDAIKIGLDGVAEELEKEGYAKSGWRLRRPSLDGLTER